MQNNINNSNLIINENPKENSKSTQITQTNEEELNYFSPKNDFTLAESNNDKSENDEVTIFVHVNPP